MDSEDYLISGMEAFRSGDIAMAVDRLEQATWVDPENFRAFTFLGAAYVEQARYNSAIGAFKRAAELNPEVAKVHYNLGQAYEAAGVPVEAWFAYKRALEINPFYQMAKAAFVDVSSRLKVMRQQRLEFAESA